MESGENLGLKESREAEFPFPGQRTRQLCDPKHTSLTFLICLKSEFKKYLLHQLSKKIGCEVLEPSLDSANLSVLATE